MPPDTPPSESYEFGLALEVLQSWRTDFGGQSLSAGQFWCLHGWMEESPCRPSPVLSQAFSGGELNSDILRTGANYISGSVPNSTTEFAG